MGEDHKDPIARIRADEQDARGQAHWLQTVLDTSPGIILIAHDRQCRSITGNRAAYEFFRVPKGENLSKSGPALERLAHYRIFHGGVELAPQEMPLHRVVASGVEVRDHEMAFHFADGTIRFLLGNIAPLRDAEGQPVGAVGVFADITDRKRAEAEAEAAHQLMETAINRLPAAINVMRGSDLRMVLVNDGYKALAPGKVMLGRTLNEIWPEVGQDFAVVCRRVLATGEPHVAADERFMIRRTPDGPDEARHFSWSLHRIRLPGDEGWGLLNSAWETTARKQAEEALRQSEEKYRTLFNSMDEGYLLAEVVFDQEKRPVDILYLEANPAAIRLAGRDFTGRRMREINPNYEDYWLEIYARIERTGEPMRAERYAAPHGRWFEFYSFRVGGPESRRVATIFQDITERKQAEEALRESQRVLSDLIERSPFGTYIVDSRFRIAMMNAGSQNGAFRNVRPVIGRPFEEVVRILWPEEVAAEIIGHFRHTLDTGEPYYSAKFLNPRADVATTESYEWELHRMTLPDGQHGVICYYYDSTKLRQAEEALRRSAETFAALVEQSPLGIYTVDSDFRVANVSVGAGPAFRNVQPIIGRDFAEVMRAIWVEPFASEAIAIFRRVLETGEPYVSPGLTEKRKDLGEIESYEWQVNRVTLADGRPGAVCYFFDATRIQQANRAARESEERLRLYFDHAPASIAVLDRDMRYLYANLRWRAEFKLGDRNLTGLSHYDVFPEIPDRWREVHRRGLRGEIIAVDEDRFERHDGSVQWLRWEVRPWYTPTSEVGGMIIYSEDITARKQAEEALRQANEQLEHRVAERTAALAHRSQQLRELASELTLAEQRERRRLAEVLHDDLQQLLVGAKFRLVPLHRSADAAVKAMASNAQELIDQSIECSRSLTAELSPPILHQGGLGPALEWLAVRMQQKHGLSVQLDIGHDAEPESEDIRVMLFQSVRELLFNVVKYAGVHTADVRLRALDDQIEVTVLDQGAGFNPQEISQRAGKAGGFGLFSIRERLDLLGGTMEIDSAPGRGSCFILRAPRRSQTPPEPCVPTTLAGVRNPRIAPSPASATGAAPSGVQVIRVLLVDDHVVVRQGLSHLLSEEADIEIVAEASDGPTAIELVRQLRPAVVTMDINMPGMDGIEATKAIHAEFPEVRVIGLSMFEEVERAQAMREAGAVDYLTKSGPSEALVAAIRAWGTPVSPHPRPNQEPARPIARGEDVTVAVRN